MALEERINQEITSAMKARAKERLEALRAIKAAILLAKTEKAGISQLPEAEELSIVQKLLKQRRESAEIYQTQNRDDLYQVEAFQASVIAEFLPPMMSIEELETVIGEILQRTGATSPKDMGKVMAVASKELAGKAEGKMISETVKKLLAQLS